MSRPAGVGLLGIAALLAASFTVRSETAERSASMQVIVPSLTGELVEGMLAAPPSPTGTASGWWGEADAGVVTADRDLGILITLIDLPYFDKSIGAAWGGGGVLAGPITAPPLTYDSPQRQSLETPTADVGQRQGGQSEAQQLERPPWPRSELEQAIAKHFPPEARVQALRIALCESRGDPAAVGARGERGVLQIHPVHGPVPPDVDGQVAQGAAIYYAAGGSFRDWSCR